MVDVDTLVDIRDNLGLDPCEACPAHSGFDCSCSRHIEWWRKYTLYKRQYSEATVVWVLNQLREQNAQTEKSEELPIGALSLIKIIEETVGLDPCTSCANSGKNCSCSKSKSWWARHKEADKKYGVLTVASACQYLREQYTMKQAQGRMNVCLKQVQNYKGEKR